MNAYRVTIQGNGQSTLAVFAQDEAAASTAALGHFDPSGLHRLAVLSVVLDPELTQAQNAAEAKAVELANVSASHTATSDALLAAQDRLTDLQTQLDAITTERDALAKQLAEATAPGPASTSPDGVATVATDS